MVARPLPAARRRTGATAARDPGRPALLRCVRGGDRSRPRPVPGVDYAGAQGRLFRLGFAVASRSGLSWDDDAVLLVVPRCVPCLYRARDYGSSGSRGTALSSTASPARAAPAGGSTPQRTTRAGRSAREAYIVAAESLPRPSTVRLDGAPLAPAEWSFDCTSSSPLDLAPRPRRRLGLARDDAAGCQLAGWVARGHHPGRRPRRGPLGLGSRPGARRARQGVRPHGHRSA
mmetsp:Transcript_18656/g.60300  ORF Transcript_18656/g.60300 Transcript_18656/m.60300 type:complete len:231 (-) Transcript_18656:313-1005(-)